MQRASYVRVDHPHCEASPGKVKTPPAATGGAVTQEAPSKENADGFARAFCIVVQARSVVNAIMFYADRLCRMDADGWKLSADNRHEVEEPYWAAWPIYQGCFPTYVRTRFPELMGVAFDDFETAMECVGEHLSEGRPKGALDSYLLPPDEVCNE